MWRKPKLPGCSFLQQTSAGIQLLKSPSYFRTQRCMWTSSERSVLVLIEEWSSNTNVTERMCVFHRRKMLKTCPETKLPWAVAVATTSGSSWEGCFIRKKKTSCHDLRWGRWLLNSSYLSASFFICRNGICLSNLLSVRAGGSNTSLCPFSVIAP